MLSYRSTFSVDVSIDDAAPRIQALMIDWAERKHRRRLGPAGLDDLQPGSRLCFEDDLEFLLSDTREESGDRVLGFVSIEGRGDATWTSQVMVGGGPRTEGRALMSVEVDAPRSKEDPTRPMHSKVPGFVRSILDSFKCDDMGIRLGNNPSIVGTDDVHVLLRELAEDDHHGLVLVAGTSPGLPLDEWVKFVGKVTAGTVGQAATYVLDVPATGRFADLVSPGHVVGEGSIRTFVPGAVFDDSDDGVRHRFLTAKTLADDRLRRRAGLVLERRSRAMTNARALDRRTRRYQSVLGRHLDEIVLGAVVPPEAPSVEAPAVAEADPQVLPVGLSQLEGAGETRTLRHRIEQLEELLAEKNVDLAEAKRRAAASEHDRDLAERRLAAAEEGAEQLFAEVDELTQERNELDLSYAEEMEAKRSALLTSQAHACEVGRLRVLLAQSGRGAEAWEGASGEVETATPADWPALAEWADDGTLARRLPYLDFTCDWDRAVDLDDQNSFSWISKTWDILLALNDYARARRDDEESVRNLFYYLEDAPSGYYTVSRNLYKPTESDLVSHTERFRRERFFPAPAVVGEVGSDGKVYMDKHFVIAQAGMVSPRLYLYDATNVKEYGKVVIGYIGRHLTNSQTN